MAGKKQAPAKQVEEEEEEEAEGWEDAVVDADGKAEADLRLRDWRDVERYREMKELRRLVDDDYGLEEIFHIPLRPRNEATVPAARAAAGKAAAAARAMPPPKGGKAAIVAKAPAPAPKASAKAAPKAAPKPAHKKPPPRLKAKAKRR